MLVCRICGQSTEYMWKCIPKFKEGDPVSHALCSRCMAIGLSCAHRIFTRRNEEPLEETGGFRQDVREKVEV